MNGTVNIQAYLLSLVLVLFFQEGQSQRKKNFPQVVEYVKEMPAPENLWVFMMAGQSNMAGRGLVEPQDTIPNKRILTIDNAGEWIYAKEPLNFNEPRFAGLDCGMSFAKALLDAVPSEVSIAMIPCAVGNTSVEQWLENDTYRGVTLLSNFEKNVNLMEKFGKIKGILWHQGEANAKTDLIPHYAKNLKKLTRKLREIVEEESLSIFIGQLGAFAQPQEWQKQWDSINAIIKAYTEEDKNAYLIYTQDLKSKKDNIHFDTASQRKMGQRFAARYLEVRPPSGQN